MPRTVAIIVLPLIVLATLLAFAAAGTAETATSASIPVTLIAPPGDTPTRVGLQATGLAPRLVHDLGVSTVHLILTDRELREAFAWERLGLPVALFTSIRQLKRGGAEIILTVRWLDTQSPIDGHDYDRVPRGADRTAALALVRRLVTVLGPHFDWYQVQNEVAGGSGELRRRDMTPANGSIPAIEWFAAVAREFKAARATNPDLKHLKLLGPALTRVETLVDGSDPQLASFLGAVIDFSGSQTDAVDLHLHVASVAASHRLIAAVRARTAHPLTSTEWSQAPAAQTWLAQPMTTGSLTNLQYLRRCYLRRVTASAWRDWLSTAPFTVGFLAEHYALLKREKFVHACYGGALQDGRIPNDLVSLYADLTVKPSMTRNEPFWSGLRALAAAPR